MSHTLTIELSEEVYNTIERRAAEANTSPSRIVVESLERYLRGEGVQEANQERSEAQLQAARVRFEQHFGAVDLGYPTGIANDGIDADLARVYGDTHEEA